MKDVLGLSLALRDMSHYHRKSLSLKRCAHYLKCAAGRRFSTSSIRGSHFVEGWGLWSRCRPRPVMVVIEDQLVGAAMVLQPLLAAAVARPLTSLLNKSQVPAIWACLYPEDTPERSCFSIRICIFLYLCTIQLHLISAAQILATQYVSLNIIMSSKYLRI